MKLRQGGDVHEERGDDTGGPPGAIHERVKKGDEGAFAGDADVEMERDPAAEADSADDRADGRPTWPGGDIDEKLARGGGGDETGVER
jgi:hypothetical protein